MLIDMYKDGRVTKVNPSPESKAQLESFGWSTTAPKAKKKAPKKAK